MNNNWKILITFTYPLEAHLAKGFLESNGVRTIIKDEYTVQVYNFYSNAIGGVKLLVNEADYNRGIKLLKKGAYLNQDAPSKNGIEILSVKSIDKSKCPFCHSDNISKKNRPSILIVIIYFILGAIFPIFKNSSYTCYDCGKEWRFKH